MPLVRCSGRAYPIIPTSAASPVISAMPVPTRYPSAGAGCAASAAGRVVAVTAASRAARSTGTDSRRLLMALSPRGGRLERLGMGAGVGDRDLLCLLILRSSRLSCKDLEL